MTTRICFFPQVFGFLLRFTISLKKKKNLLSVDSNFLLQI